MHARPHIGKIPVIGFVLAPEREHADFEDAVYGIHGEPQAHHGLVRNETSRRGQKRSFVADV